MVLGTVANCVQVEPPSSERASRAVPGGSPDLVQAAKTRSPFATSGSNTLTAATDFQLAVAKSYKRRSEVVAATIPLLVTTA